MSLRKMSYVLVAVVILLASVGAASAAAAKAASTPFALSIDNNVTVHKDAPNLQFTTTSTNNTGVDAVCYQKIKDTGYISETFVLGAHQTVSGFGMPFPSTKHSTLTIDLVCNGDVVATASGKVTMTGQAG